MPAKTDYFLNVLTAADASVKSVEQASVENPNNQIIISLEGVKIIFFKDEVNGSIEINGKNMPFANKIKAN